jgi:hypothetical protein
MRSADSQQRHAHKSLIPSVQWTGRPISDFMSYHIGYCITPTKNPALRCNISQHNCTKTHQRTLMSRHLHETLTAAQLVTIAYILWNPKFQYRVHNSLPLVSTLSSVQSLSLLTTIWKIYFNIILLSTLGYSKLFFPLRIPAKSYTYFSFLPYMPHAETNIPPWFNHPNNIWYFISTSSLCIIAQPPVIFYILGPNYSSAPYSLILSFCVRSWMCQPIFNKHTKQKAKLQIAILLFTCFQKAEESKIRQQ